MMSLFSNIRFYVLLGSFWLVGMTAILVAYASEDSRLALIRAQEIFGFASLLYLYAALLVTPLMNSFPIPYKSQIFFARRAIGVSAFTFALLHAVLAFFFQFGGFSSLDVLSSVYFTSFLLGAFGLTILFLMAATSFDKAIETMSFTWWKRLHRMVFAAGFAVLVHVYMIGSHFTDITSLPSIIFLSALTLLLTMYGIGLDRRTSLRFGSFGPFTFSVMVTVIMFAASLLVARLIEIDVIQPVMHEVNR